MSLSLFLDVNRFMFYCRRRADACFLNVHRKDYLMDYLIYFAVVFVLCVHMLLRGRIPPEPQVNLNSVCVCVSVSVRLFLCSLRKVLTVPVQCLSHKALSQNPHPL